MDGRGMDSRQRSGNSPAVFIAPTGLRITLYKPLNLLGRGASFAWKRQQSKRALSVRRFHPPRPQWRYDA